MSEDLKARVQASAEASGRSLHGELLHRLQRSFEPGGHPSDAVDALRYDLAEAEMDKHVLALMVKELAFLLRRATSAAKGAAGPFNDEQMKWFDWTAETADELQMQAEKRLGRDLAAATKAITEAAERMSARSALLSEAAGRRLPLRLPTSLFEEIPGDQWWLAQEKAQAESRPVRNVRKRTDRRLKKG